jgi:hypothetical protein
MARPDPLQAAAGYYTAQRWEEQEWRDFGRETGTSDILNSHARLFRSLSFGDPDYPDAALGALALVLEDGVEPGATETERMELLADAMPDLPAWIKENAPARTKRLFDEYLSARDPSEIPAAWSNPSTIDSKPDTDFSFPRDPTNEVYRSPAPEDPTNKGYRSPPLDEPWDVPSYTAVPVGPLAPTAAQADVPLASFGPNERIFIVHGHDEAALNSIRVYVHRETGVMPISLAEEASEGQTIIEKFESYGEASTYVIVLLTPDDVGQTAVDYDAGLPLKHRARQNVVLELGYFIGKLGRKRIVVVNKDVERPSDFAGLGYVQYPGTNWKDDLRKELLSARLTR